MPTASLTRSRAESSPGAADEPTPVKRRRGSSAPASIAAARASKPSWPPDLESAATIRSKPIKSEPPDPDPSAQI